MAAPRAFICITVLAIFARTSLAADYDVGGSSSWSLSTDLATWASKQSFKVGDSITFTYDSQHSVNEVNKADYAACSLSKPITSHTGGSTKIELMSSGKRYFICGTAGHCDSGMKIEIATVSTAVATPPRTPPVSPTIPPPSKAPLAPSPSKASLTPPPVKSPPMVPGAAPPTKAPSRVSPKVAPASNTPRVGEPTPLPSGANKLVMGLVTSLIMIALF